MYCGTHGNASKSSLSRSGDEPPEECEEEFHDVGRVGVFCGSSWVCIWGWGWGWDWDLAVAAISGRLVESGRERDFGFGLCEGEGGDVTLGCRRFVGPIGGR
jgi:hypothetical protein